MLSLGRSWPRLALWGAGIALGAWLRLQGLDTLPLHGDEHHTLLAADRSLGEILTTFDSVGSHVPLPLLQKLALDLFGPGVLAFRLVAIVPGLLLLVLALPLLAPFFGRDEALLATLALAVNPMVVYYARFARGYELALLLALCLGWALHAVLDSARRRPRTWVALIASATLLPWVHLSTLGFVLALAGAGLGLALRSERALALRLAGAFALAGLLCAALFLPVFGQVLEYFRVMESESPPLDWFGVPTLLAGGRAAAFLWLAGLALGAALAWREARAGVVLAFAALLGPLALLLVSRPRGLDYAWARYVMSAVPFLLALAAAGLTGLARWRGRSSAWGLAAGTLVVSGLHLAGPLAALVPADRSFSNTYLALHELPAFDQPSPTTSLFYRALAEDPEPRRIVEAPPIYTRGVLLYRNYALQHGKEAWIGWAGEPPRGIQGKPYAPLLEPIQDPVDYVVLHRDPAREAAEYFRFVYDEVWPRIRREADESFMLRQMTIYDQTMVDADQIASIAGRLYTLYGPATFKDESILVWKLER